MSVSEDITLFSCGNLRYESMREHGAIAYDLAHERQEIVFPTRDVNEVHRRNKLGWKITLGYEGYLLRAPEACAMDLADPFLVHGNLHLNLALFRTFRHLRSSRQLDELLDEVVSHHEGFCIYQLNGSALETQIRFAGSDIRIYDVVHEIVTLIMSTPSWRENLEKSKCEIPILRELAVSKKPISTLSCCTRDFSRRVHQIRNVIDLGHVEEIAICGVWNEIPQADTYIFVPRRGLSLAAGFVEHRQTYDDVMLWEYHSGKPLEDRGWIFPKCLMGKTVAIIDVSYTGTTLSRISDKVVLLGGKPFRIALFPKSKKALENAEMIVFLDKFCTENLSTLSLVSDQFEKLYIDVSNSHIPITDSRRTR